jgi:hypothetical protein
MSILTDVYTQVVVALSQTETPVPMPGFDGNEDLVTPTWVGFLMTFLVAVATLLLILDMTKRIRRTRYREEIRAQLATEAAEATGVAGASGTAEASGAAGVAETAETPETPGTAEAAGAPKPL